MGALVLCAICAACSHKTKTPDFLDYGDPDLSGETSANLESAARYQTRFKNGDVNIGDVMPYYHDGIYSFFYLAETSNHPVYRVDTADFVHYEDKGEVLSPGASNAQDSMIGTGSVVQAGNDFYFFYTGFKKDTPEAVMAAKSVGSIDAFRKIDGFMLTAAGSDLEGWDFRDPEAIYDSENECFVLLVSARRGGVPVIAMFTVSLDLTKTEYKGVVYEDARLGANVLECSDLFRMGDKWYLTYSVQDVSNGGADGAHAAEAGVGTQGKVYYAMADSMFGPFTRLSDASLDSHVFYAAKTVQDGANTYLAGWIRQKNSNIGWQYVWGGNLQVHQLLQNPDGSLSVALPPSVRNYYSVERKLDDALTVYNGFDMIEESKTYHTVSPEYSSYLLHATVTFDADVTECGFALGVSSNVANIMEVAFVPSADKIRASMSGQQELAAKNIRLTAGEEYDVTLLAEGSAVTMYVNNAVAFSSRIRNLGNKKLAVYAKNGTASVRDLHLYTPSDYADTLSSGYGQLTVSENGQAQKGHANKVRVSPDAPAAVTYTATQENFLRYTAAVYADSAVRVTVKANGKTVREHAAAAERILQTSGTAYAAAGDTLTWEISADAPTDVWVNAAVETDKKPFSNDLRAEYENSGTSAFTAGESGVYEYIATMYYDGEISGRPMLETNNARAAVTEGARLVTLRGAVRLNAGQSLQAALLYNEFAAQAGAHRTVLQIRAGATDTFAAGLGTYAAPVAKPCHVAHETPLSFASVQVSDGREMSVEMNGDVFGEQGQNGFVYAYGKASDELFAMTEYNTNGFVWEYKHKAPEANDALEIKADYMKQGGGYVTAVVWIAPSDGYIDVTADYTRNSGYAQVQVLRNRTLLYDKFLHEEDSRADIALTSVEVKAGDGIVLSVRAAGRDMGENDGNYHLRIGKGNTHVPFDPSAPLIADFAADYNTDRNGDYGWRYLHIGYTWEGGERPTDVQALQKTDFGWGVEGSGMDGNGVIYGGVAAAWRNDTPQTLAVSVSGSVTGHNADVRLWILRADGTSEFVAFYSIDGVCALPNKAYLLSSGDSLAVLFFENKGAGCTLDMQVRASADIEIDDTALAQTLSYAQSITNEDDRYTNESFALLQTEIENARKFSEEMAASRKTYTEISQTVAALRAAIDGLRLDTSAARAELDAQIAAAEKWEGKELLGDAAAFAEALAAAKTVAKDQNATSERLTEAAETLKNAMQNVRLLAADLYKDFGGEQGGNGWVYGAAEIENWDTFAGTWLQALPFDSDRYGNDNRYIRKADGSVVLYGGAAAVGYYNYTGEAHSYTFALQAAYLDGVTQEAALTVAVLRRDGNTELYQNNNWHSFTDGKISVRWTVTLQAGEQFAVILRNAGDAVAAATLALQVGCNDALTPLGNGVLLANGDWTVYNANIDFGAGKLTDMVQVPFIAADGCFAGNGTEVTAGACGGLRVTATSGVALVFTAPSDGTYTVTVGNVAGTRGNGRWYRFADGAFSEDGFFGRNAAQRSVTLKAGEQYAVHFEGELNGFMLMLWASA